MGAAARAMRRAAGKADMAARRSAVLDAQRREEKARDEEARIEEARRKLEARMEFVPIEDMAPYRHLKPLEDVVEIGGGIRLVLGVHSDGIVVDRA